MSSFWSSSDLSDATPVAGWGEFGSVAPRGNFRTRFGGLADEIGWTPGGLDGRAARAPEAFAEPEPDPVEQASREAFIAGFREGERVTREAMEADDAARRALADAIAQVSGAGEGALASLLSQAVLRLVTQIVGAVPIDEAMLAERCAAVAACIDADDGKVVLEVNPEDMGLIDAGAVTVALSPNPQLPRGSVRLATADGWIEDGPGVRLDRLKALMDDMEGKL